MTNTTLRQKFAMGCALVFVIVVMALLGGRLFGKAAWLYQVERDHLVQVLDMKVAAKAVMVDSNAAQISAGFFIDAIEKAKALTQSTDAGLLGAEKLMFRLTGESEVLAFAEQNLVDLNALAALVPNQRTTLIDSAMAASLLPAITAIKANADNYVTHLSNSVEKSSMIVHSINLLGGLALIAAFFALRQRVLKPLSEALGFANRIARGDLSVRKRTHPDDEFGRLMIALTDMQANLGSMVTNVTRNSTQIADISNEFADGNLELNARMETQANALLQTASAMEELGSSAIQNSDSARRVNDLAVSASAEAVEGGKVVSSAIETMKGISAASREISDIIAVIDDIAFQTNILALNAAVEAARAGEQGRGFAVVASEVRSLAGRSAEAARQITTLIDTSVERVTQGEALVEQAGTTMTQVVESITSVTELIGGISSASNEQRIGVTDVGDVFSGMDEATQHNARLVDNMASSAAQLKNQTQELVEAVSVFKLTEEPGRGQQDRA